jgi:hypothetical protein
MFPVEAFQQTLARLIAILRHHGIRFHLTGGLTGTAYGEPRMTQDIDLVIDPLRTRRVVEDLIRSLAASDFMYDEPSLRCAVEAGGLFQLLDTKESLKLDVYPRELIPGELGRSVLLEIFQGEFLPVVSRADAVGSKLIWISKGSHKSRRDVRAMVRQASEAERERIRITAEDLGLAALLDEVLHEPDEMVD